MVKFINKHTGSSFWVTDERKEEYKAAGHKLAASPSAAKIPVEEPKEITPKKGESKKFRSKGD